MYAIRSYYVNKISPDDQKIVSDVMTRALKEIDRLNRQDNVKAIEALKKQGIKFITPSQEQMNEWMAAAVIV